MLENKVVTADKSAVSVFDDANQRLLTDELNQVGQAGYGGVLSTLLNSALDQGHASYRELLQIKLVSTHLAQGIENLLTVVTSFKPMDRSLALALIQQQVATLSLDSQLLAAQTHPLIQD